MTSSNSLKKILSIGTALMLAIGGSLVSATPASAAAATAAPAIVGAPLTGVSLSVTQAVWPSGSAAGSWYICDRYSVTADTAATSVPNGCEPLYTARLDTSPITTPTFSVPGIAYCANMCTPFGNNSVGSKLRWIEVNGSDISASPALVIREGVTLSSIATLTVGATSVTVYTGSGCTFASPTLSSFADFTVLADGSAKTITSISTANNIVINFSGAITSGQIITVSYTKSTDPEISCGASAVIANTPAPLSRTASSGSSSNNNQNNSPTPCAGQTGLTNVTLSVSSATRTGTYRRIFNNEPTLNNCYLPQMALSTGTYVNGVLLGTIFSSLSVGLGAFTTDRTLTALETPLGRQLVAGDVITFKYWSGVSDPQVAAAQAATFAPTLTIVSVDATNVAESLPVWAGNIVQSIPTLTKRLTTSGGSVALTGGDYADLKSITIGGKAVAHKLEADGHVSIPVPTGEAGKTADIVIVFAGGTMTVLEGIKYVAQVNVANVVERPIAIAAGAKRITETVADEIRHAALANMNNDSISCVAYSANNTAKAKAAAKLTAVQACGVATKANPGLKASVISIIVNKTKAMKSAVGIKVYKATN